jgi:hypothetical protein
VKLVRVVLVWQLRRPKNVVKKLKDVLMVWVSQTYTKTLCPPFVSLEGREEISINSFVLRGFIVQPEHVLSRLFQHMLLRIIYTNAPETVLIPHHERKHFNQNG